VNLRTFQARVAEGVVHIKIEEDDHVASVE
jgi:hypothetical protein